MLDIKKLLAKITAWIAGVNDFVVEQGTSGGWRYIKWNSGNAVCWCIDVRSITVGTASPSYGGYRSGQNTKAFPFTFASAPSISYMGCAGYTGEFVTNGQGVNTTTAIWYVAGFSKSNAKSMTTHIIAFGRWK